MFIQKNYNPNNKNEGDCLVRALTPFHEGAKTYEQIKEELYKIGKKLEKSYCSDTTILYYCKENNLKVYVSNNKRDEYILKIAKKHKLDNTVFGTKNKRMTINKFSQFNEGKTVVCTRDHAVYIENKDHVDTWDSGRCFINYVIRK